jgi:U2-associated protein SR140
VAEVKGHGQKYEESLKEMEKDNPRYSFLTDRRHRKHRFYQSLLKKDGSGEPEFEDEGYNSVFSTDSAEESEKERTRKTKLGKLARKRFEAMLRSLSGLRGELARCMAFSLEHAEASNEVADIIIASLVVDGTPVPRKLARLHLICDILHNSAAPLPMAWKFRQEFQSRLGLVFDHFSTIYHSFPGRITAETFKSQITAVLDLWEDWIVFSPEFTLHLRRRIEGQVQEDTPVVEEDSEVVEEPTPAPVSRFKTSSFKPADEIAELPKTTTVQDDGSGTPMDTESDVDGQPLGDIDGEPLENLDGEPMDDVDGTPLDDDIDGAPLEDDVDGAPLDEDIDGAPMGDVDGEPMI